MLTALFIPRFAHRKVCKSLSYQLKSCVTLIAFQLWLYDPVAAVFIEELKVKEACETLVLPTLNMIFSYCLAISSHKIDFSIIFILYIIYWMCKTESSGQEQDWAEILIVIL